MSMTRRLAVVALLLLLCASGCGGGDDGGNNGEAAVKPAPGERPRVGYPKSEVRFIREMNTLCEAANERMLMAVHTQALDGFVAEAAWLRGEVVRRMSILQPPRSMVHDARGLMRALRIMNSTSRIYAEKLRKKTMRGYGWILKRLNAQIRAARRLSQRMHLVSCPTY